MQPQLRLVIVVRMHSLLQKAIGTDYGGPAYLSDTRKFVMEHRRLVSILGGFDGCRKDGGTRLMETFRVSNG